MKREHQNQILGAVFSLTYSLYPIEMTDERNALVRRALAALGEDCGEPERDALLFDLHQSKYDLNPGCQSLFGRGYYPDDFTDSFRKMDRQDEAGAAARALFQTLQTPHPDWDAALMYRAIRAIYNEEYGAQRIDEIRAQLLA